jgi:hypothetical protein
MLLASVHAALSLTRASPVSSLPQRTEGGNQSRCDGQDEVNWRAESTRRRTGARDALNTIARARAEEGDAAAFRLMQHQVVRVGQRRVELRMQMAQLSWP